jgi:GNAT superfamily N-acetyltransferase
MFCSVELAARIERAECRLVADGCANLAERIADVSVTPIAGGLAALAEPGSPLNKVVGLGFAEFDEAAFVAIEQAHAARAAAVQVELATLADPDLGKWLTARGYQLVGVENVLGRSLPIEPSAPRSDAPELRLAGSGEAEFEAWIAVFVDGFLVPDLQGVPAHEQFERAMIEATIRDFARADAVLRYLALHEGVPVGAATMRASEGVAQLCGASTLPAHRRRGVQSSLLERRLLDAAREGCTVAVVTTQPGSKSQHNVQRQGFALLYSRNILRRDP